MRYFHQHERLPQSNSQLSTLNSPLRRGFTLVELLVVIVIITVLASLSLTVLVFSQREAKVQRTRSTIVKIDTAIAEIYEKYDSFSLNANFIFNPDVRADMQAQVRADAQIHFLRDTLRMEMPDCFADVMHSDGTLRLGEPFSARNPALADASDSLRVPPPAVVNFYYNQIARAYNITDTASANVVLKPLLPDDTVNPDYVDPALQSAECLYLIVANLNPSALEHIQGTEIGDTNGNGIPEFHDAWGTPIGFMRFAPALVASDRQADVITASGQVLGTDGHNADPNRWPVFSSMQPEQFDSATSPLVQQCAFAKHLRGDALNLAGREFDVNQGINNNLPATYNSWYLYPVIVSAGPDRIFDMRFGAHKSSHNDINPFDFPVGIPEALYDGTTLHTFDNIHSHQMR